MIKNSFTTHVVNYSNSVIIIKNVPCEECEQCGEIFYTDEVAEQLEKLVEAAKSLLQDISVIEFRICSLYFYLKKQGNAFNLLLFYPNKAIINRIT